MNEIEKTLKKNNIRPTAMRIMVYKKLNQRNTALSLRELENDFENSERSTLYRTIKTFEENGIVHQIEDGTGIPKYALCEENCKCEVGSDLHLHFHCNKCSETVCLTEHKIPQINLPEAYVAENINLTIRGVCDKCSKC